MCVTRIAVPQTRCAQTLRGLKKFGHMPVRTAYQTVLGFLVIILPQMRFLRPLLAALQDISCLLATMPLPMSPRILRTQPFAAGVQWRSCTGQTCLGIAKTIRRRIGQGLYPLQRTRYCMARLKMQHVLIPVNPPPT